MSITSGVNRTVAYGSASGSVECVRTSILRGPALGRNVLPQPPKAERAIRAAVADAMRIRSIPQVPFNLVFAHEPRKRQGDGTIPSRSRPTLLRRYHKKSY